MSKTKKNHYIAQWYQKGFFYDSKDKLHHLNLSPDRINSLKESIKYHNNYTIKSPANIFFTEHLYSTFLENNFNDSVERILFGNIDNIGSRAVNYFINGEFTNQHKYFNFFFEYLDAQKIRTPKGLDWIKKYYSNLKQNDLMQEMQGLRQLNCTTWLEGVKEIVSAENSEIKFIFSDHPVTIYNFGLSLEENDYKYPYDPSINLKGSQTIFPLDKNHCLILTNYEYAKNPDTENLKELRTDVCNFRKSLTRTDNIIRTRSLKKQDVESINYIIKKRANKYIAAGKKEWLYPENNINIELNKIQKILLPPKNELSKYGGEIFAKFESGHIQYQNEFGGTTRKENRFLKGISSKDKVLLFIKQIENILGLSEGKDWDYVRKELNVDHIKKIYTSFDILYPKDTNIIDILPKPNGNLRAVYTGFINFYNVSTILISVIPHFDEIIIQNPFMHINIFSDDENYFNQFKNITLEHIYLILFLKEFILVDKIILVPNITLFSSYLAQQIVNLSEERLKKYDYKNDTKFNNQFNFFNRKYLKNLLLYNPETTLNQYIKKEDLMYPEYLLKNLEQEKLKNPLILLQDNVFENNGQLMNVQLFPNFEISLFICQITESILLTDNYIRWQEISEFQANSDSNKWGNIISTVYNFDFMLNRNQFFVYNQIKSDKKDITKALFKNIYLHTKNLIEDFNINSLDEEIKVNLLKISNRNNNIDYEKYYFCCKFKFFIPNNGIHHNNVNRLLIATGNEKYIKNIPLAIFMEHNYFNL